MWKIMTVEADWTSEIEMKMSKSSKIQWWNENCVSNQLFLSTLFENRALEHVFSHIFRCNRWEFESISSLNSHEFRLQYDATQSLQWSRFKDQNWTLNHALFFLQELESSLFSFQWFLKHEISLNQSDDYVSQSMYDSECALIESSEKRVTDE